LFLQLRERHEDLVNIIHLGHEVPNLLTTKRFNYDGFSWLDMESREALRKRLVLPTPTEQLVVDVVSTGECMFF
jgi:hypothetical protein